MDLHFLEQRIERFFNHLEELKGVSSVSNFTGGDDDNFKLYNAISGFLNGSYFSLYFNVWGNEPFELKICGTTECKKEIKAILKEFDFKPNKRS